MGSGKTGAGPNRGWNLVRFVLASLLLTASALKCWQLATEPVVETSLLDSRWLLMATVELELFFGIWLLANIWAKPTWAAALACFGLFTCVSLCKAISGHASCGCFGRVSVNPWYTGTLDLAIVFSLLQWRPKESFFTSGRATAVLVIWLLIGIPAVSAMCSYSPTTLSNDGGIIGNGKIVVLEPETWIGKRFPLLDYIDIGDTLSEGDWLVLLYHHDCSKCQQVVRDLPQVMHKLGTKQIALIEMPPYGDSSMMLDHVKEIRRFGKLDDNREWFASTPALIGLKGGQVVAANLTQSGL